MFRWQQNYGSAMQELLSFTFHIISRKISEISWNIQWPITWYESNYISTEKISIITLLL